MKYKMKSLISILIFLLIIPSAQANVFDDIKNIDEGINQANDQLSTIKSGIDNMNSIMENVSDSVVLLEETNTQLNQMGQKIDELTIKADEALDISEKADNYLDEIKMFFWFVIGAIIIGLITLISSTLIILRRKR